MRIVAIARKPLDGTVVENVSAYGTGAVNVDGCRIAHNEECKPMKAQPGGNKMYAQAGRYEPTTELKPEGRWPSNVVLASDNAAADLDAQSGVQRSPSTYVRTADSGNVSAYGKGVGELAGTVSLNYGDTGGASRYFKMVAPKPDRRK